MMLDMLRGFETPFFPNVEEFFKLQPRSTGNVPRYNFEEKEKEYQLFFELPGFNKEDVKIEVKHNSLKLFAKRTIEYDKESTLQRQERQSYTYDKVFSLPSDVISQKVEAKFENGLLSLTLPKKEDTQTQLITIK